MPIFDIECESCGEVWEFLQVKSDDFPVCPKCNSSSVKKIFTTFNVRMDATVMKHELPDPTPPLTEAKPCEGSETGLRDLPRSELKDYTRTKDKYGNNIWKEKRRTYFGAGGSRKSSAEQE